MIEFTQLALNIILFSGLGLLGIGFYSKGRGGHLYNIAGWTLFGVYWIAQVPFYLQIRDLVNAIFSAFALPFFLFLAHHEHLSYKWDEEVRTLRFMSGIAFIAGGIYFLIEKIPYIAGALIYAVAYKSVLILTLFGYPVEIGEIQFGSEVYVPVYPSESLSIAEGAPSISIILACTGIQSIAVFIGAIYCTKTDKERWRGWAEKVVNAEPKGRGKLTLFFDGMRKNKIRKLLQMSDRERKLKAFMYTVPVIYFANLFRNAGVIYVVWNGIVEFDVAHHYYAKSLALILLIILTFIVFDLLPELHENIVGLGDLVNRKRGELDESGKEIKETGVQP